MKLQGKGVRLFGVMVGLISLAGCQQALIANPKTDLSNYGSVSVASEDPRMTAAIAMAGKTLPEFIKKLDHLTPGDDAQVKTEFHENGRTQYVWVYHVSYANAKFSGFLDDQEQYSSPNLKPNMPMVVPEVQVADWLILRQDGSKQGGYTVDVIDSILAERAGASTKR